MSGVLPTVVSIVGSHPDDGVDEATAARIAERIGPYGGRHGSRSGTVHFASARDAVRFAAAVRRDATLHRTGIDADAAEDDAARTAAALAAYARPGEILVTDVVLRLAGHATGTRFVDRGRVRPPGVDDRLQLHAVVDGSEPPVAPPLHGRRTELAAAVDALQFSCDGAGSAVVIEGEAGIGKSHLARATADAARARGMAVVVGRADELGIEDAGLLSSLAAALGVGDDDDHRRGNDPAFAVIERLVDEIHRTATHAPLLIVAEDLHWADETSLRFLRTLGRTISPLPVCVLATARPRPRPAGLEEALASLRQLHGHGSTLAPLDDESTTAVATARFGAVPGDGLRALIRTAGGNPLHVTELLRVLEDEGALRVDRGVVELDPDARPALEPDRAADALGSTVRRRLDSLPAVTSEILRLASLLGSAFSLDDLATITARPVVDLARVLAPAIDAGVLDGHGERLTFHHDLIHDAVYGAIPPAVRRDLHTAAGRALASSGAPAATVAGHFAVGARRGDEVAIDWLGRAADEASRLDTRVAADLYERARALVPEHDPRRLDLDAALVAVLADSGRVDATMAAADDLLARAAIPAHEVAARRARAAALVTLGDLKRAADECRAAARSADDTDDADALTAGAAAMDIIAGGDISTAQSEAAAASGRTRRGVACWAEQTLGIAALASGRYHDAGAHFRRSRRLLESRHVPTMGFLIPHTWEAGVLGLRDDHDGARAASNRARRRAERRGEIPLLAQAHVVRAMTDHMGGEWDDALAELDAIDGIAADTGTDPQRILVHGLRASIAFDRGDRAMADAELTAGLARIEQGDQHLFGVEILVGTAARVHLDDGDPASARGLLELLWEQVGPIVFMLQFGSVVPMLIRLRRADGDLEGADALARLIARLDGNGIAGHQALVRRCRGIADGDPVVLREAVAAARRSPRLIEVAGTLEDAARVHLAHGSSTDARSAVDEAVRLLEPMGADGWIHRLHGLVGRPAETPAPRATHGWDALSPKEHEVIHLVAEGLSNPEIAELLYISRRTVESHLSHVFRKLGLSNRTQLARAALERTG